MKKGSHFEVKDRLKARIGVFLFLLLVFTFSLFIYSCGSTNEVALMATAPANCNWKNFEISEHTRAAQMRASDMGPRWTKRHRFYRLILRSREGKMRRISLGYNLKGTHGDAYRIEFSGNCQAAAISADYGSSYYYLALDAKQPFICRHRKFRSLKKLWTEFPTTNHFVLGILGRAYIT